MNLGKQGDPLPIAASFHSLPRLVRFRASTAPRYSYPARVAALRFSVLANDVLRLVGPGLVLRYFSASDPLLAGFRLGVFCGSRCVCSA